MWPGLTEAERDAICHLPEVPIDLRELNDFETSYYFWYYVWSHNDEGMRWGQLTLLAYFLHFRTYGSPADLVAFVLDPESQDNWPPEILASIPEPTGSTADAGGSSVHLLLEATYDTAVKHLADWYWAFADEVKRMRHWAFRESVLQDYKKAPKAQLESTPVVPSFGRESVDQQYCDRVNKLALAELPHGQATRFVISRELLLIGYDHPPSYFRILAQEGREGNLKLINGGLRIRVQALRQGSDRQDFLRALRRISRKPVTFR